MTVGLYHTPRTEYLVFSPAFETVADGMAKVKPSQVINRSLFGK